MDVISNFNAVSHQPLTLYVKVEKCLTFNIFNIHSTSNSKSSFNGKVLTHQIRIIVFASIYKVIFFHEYIQAVFASIYEVIFNEYIQAVNLHRYISASAGLFLN